MTFTAFLTLLHHIWRKEGDYNSMYSVHILIAWHKYAHGIKHGATTGANYSPEDNARTSFCTTGCLLSLRDRNCTLNHQTSNDSVLHPSCCDNYNIADITSFFWWLGFKRELYSERAYVIVRHRITYSHCTIRLRVLEALKARCTSVKSSSCSAALRGERRLIC